MMEAHHMMNFHHMMELHHVMGFHHCVIRQINFSCALHYALKVIHLYNFHDELGEMVKPLFVASIASLTLVMTSMASTIQLLQQMGILPAFGTCSNCSSPTGARGGYRFTKMTFLHVLLQIPLLWSIMSHFI